MREYHVVGADERWAAVDRWFAERLLAPDPLLEEVTAASADAGLPPHEVAPNQGKLLHLLARAVGARAILELGTLGGYSTIWLARALPPGGRLVSLELEAAYAEVARANLARAGLGETVDIRVGPALETLAAVEGPFDLVFLDADKRASAEYLRWALRLARPGTLIVADNVVRGGAVAGDGAGDESAAGVRRFAEALAAEPRVEATALQTVGEKGWDGFVLALVVS